VTSSYNETGRVTEVSSAEGTIDYQYNGQGYLVSVTNMNGDKVSYTYDAYGNRTSMTYPDGRMVSYTYDAMNRMTSVTGLD
ncbi:RHS repeat protein, partial [Escherichia coli]|nr:RHS repeat protein [Escherichia coli]